MNKRTKRKLHNLRLYMIKNVLNGGYFVRNLMIATIFMAVLAVAMGVVVFSEQTVDAPEEVVAAEERQTIHITKMDNLNPVSIPVIMSDLDTGVEPEVQPNDTEMVTDTSVDYENLMVAIADEVNVRAKATTDSDIIGKLNYGNVGEVISEEGDWIYFKSGEVTGYVKSDFVVIGEEAKEYMESEDSVATPVEVEVEEDEEEEIDNSNTKPKQEEESEAPVVQTPTVEETTTEAPTTEAPTTEESTTEETTTEETTTEEETDDTTSDNFITVQPTNRGPIVLTQEEINLMACIVTLESGSESYEGQLAVANVILNRLQNGYWGDTVTEVIYAPYQFSSVNSPYLDYYLENGAFSTSIRAVNDALAGNNNIGSFLYFRAMYIVDDPDSFGTHTIIGNHLFY